MRSIIKYFNSTKQIVLAMEALNICAGIAFIVVGVTLAILNNPLFLLLCLGTILNILFIICLCKYRKILEDTIFEIEILSKKLREATDEIETEKEHRKNIQQINKIRAETEKQLEKMRNPFEVGDTVKNKFNIYSEAGGETVPSGTHGKVIESKNDILKVSFVVNGKKIIASEKIDYFKKVY